MTFSRDIAEVHDDHLRRAVTAPAPADEVLPGVVACPAAALPELPLAGAKDSVAHAAKEALVEGSNVDVPFFGGSTSEEHRQLHSAPVELPLVNQASPRLGQRRPRRRACLPGRERRRGWWLVVVLDETDEPVLVAAIGEE